MKETLPIAQSGGLAATVVGQRPLRDRRQPQGEDFNAALARQKMDRNPKLNADPRGMTHEQRDPEHAALHSEPTKETRANGLRPELASRSRLPEPVKGAQLNKPRDAERDDFPSKDDRQSALAHLLPPQTAGNGPDPAMVAQFLGISTPANPNQSVPTKDLHTRLVERADDDIAAQTNTSVLDAEVDGRHSIADTPVTVREQQTHFARDPLGRPDLMTTGRKPETQVAAEIHDAPSRGLAQALAKANEATQRANVEPDRIIGPKSDVSSGTPSATIQLLGKILEACDEQFNPTRSSAPSAPIHSTERPFGSMVRLIRIELSPASLGLVHVTLKGANAALSISIEAERSQTAASLGADRSSLSTRLTEAGYAIDELVVKAVDRPPDVAPPTRPDPTVGSSSNTLAAGTDDPQRRQADDSWRRPHPEQNRHAQATARNATQGDSANEEIASPTARRGRHQTRSV